MYNANYRILIEYPETSVVCLGSQFIEILDFLEKLLPPHVWYAANIDTNYFYCEYLFNFRDFSLKKFGNISKLKKAADQTEQFLSGVFIAVTKEIIKLVEVDTEDEQFRPLEIDNVILEIRAFDTSFFELFSDDYELIKKIAEKFNVNIEKSPNLGE